MSKNNQNHRAILKSIAHRAMLERDLLPDFSVEALAELERLQVPSPTNGESIRDMRSLLWVSIDNDDSRDLDQLTLAEVLRGDNIQVLVAIADVDTFIKDGSAIDEHARHNTTSV
jgi:exoribonuclease-2